MKLSANWMAAAGSAGEDAALFDTVRAVATDLCPALGISIPVGKDSMSMRTTWSDADGPHAVVSPVSLVVSAFGPCDDIRETLTPQLRLDAGLTDLIFIDLARGQARLGASVLAQVHGQVGADVPDVEDPASVRSLFAAMGALRQERLALAYHDRSDGGLIVTLLEMAFAGHCGLTIDADAIAATDDSLLAGLFAEELGAVVQVRSMDVARTLEVLRAHGLDARVVARLSDDGMVRVQRGTTDVFSAARTSLHRAWSETTWLMQSLRDNPVSAQQEYDRILDEGDPGLSPHLTFDADDDCAAPFVSRGIRPPMAILREQGVNGEVEMAAAFERAGFAAHDVHMSDIIAGRVVAVGLPGIRGVRRVFVWGRARWR